MTKTNPEDWSRRTTLEKLRDRLIRELHLIESSGGYDMPLGKDAPALSRELRRVMSELESLPSEEDSAPEVIQSGRTSATGSAPGSESYADPGADEEEEDEEEQFPTVRARRAADREARQR